MHSVLYNEFLYFQLARLSNINVIEFGNAFPASSELEQLTISTENYSVSSIDGKIKNKLKNASNFIECKIIGSFQIVNSFYLKTITYIMSTIFF